MISANDSSLDKYIQGAQRMQQAGNHRLNEDKPRALPRNSVWRQLWHSKQVPRDPSCTEPRRPGAAGLGCQRYMHSVNTRVQSTHCEPGTAPG